MIRAILFDLDGVLVDAADLHFEALNRALQEVCGRPVAPEDRNLYEGLSTRQKLAMMVTEGRIAAGTEDAIYRLKQERTIIMVWGGVEPDPIKQAMCRYLKGGYLLGCVSNCVRASVDALLAASNLMRWMKVTVSNEDVTNPKPAPDPYLLACLRLGVRPSEALAVEDHERGIHSAESAGCHVLALQYANVNLLHVKAALDGFKETRCFR